ncbi:hypothetical protein SAE01_15360 [Segetibacter aerophilus]|uniref:histidine kinase n=2 Tax=Segetibacter aerophilus TaxID=670293 RepID=A0A512BAQ9_9BACT|nr:hypothetical protein SAE01_15360 [Segetibacter aerophilus]
MVVTLFVITAFQCYWIYNNYQREATTLRVKSNSLFRQVVEEVQASHLRFDTVKTKNVKEVIDNNLLPAVSQTMSAPANVSRRSIVRLTNTVVNRLKDDSTGKGINNRKEVFITLKPGSSFISNDSIHPHTIKLDTINPASIGNVVIINGVRSSDSSSAQDFRLQMAERLMSRQLPPLGTNRHVVRMVLSEKDSNRQKERRLFFKKKLPNMPPDVDFVYRISTPFDSLPLNELSNAYTTKSSADRLNVPFNIYKTSRKEGIVEEKDNEVLVGIEQPSIYRLELGNSFPYLIEKISLPIGFSFFLVAVTLLSFVAFYTSLIRQHKLAEVKNDFISNITHELKTPIATVSVAIEALRNFNALQDKERTKEYLDISEGELNRLSLLVDKVLKFSMFEQDKIELQVDTFDMRLLVEEVVSYLRVQLDKAGAIVKIEAEGNTEMKGDFIHLQSVIFNLLDNAIKYTGKDAAIKVDIKGSLEQLVIAVKDNGPGIAQEYKDKIFEKFFRVPTGNQHNVKGYGLGLSYVAHVIQMHKGMIEVESSEGKGSSFIIKFPR